MCSASTTPDNINPLQCFPWWLSNPSCAIIGNWIGDFTVDGQAFTWLESQWSWLSELYWMNTCENTKKHTCYCHGSCNTWNNAETVSCVFSANPFQQRNLLNAAPSNSSTDDRDMVCVEDNDLALTAPLYSLQPVGHWRLIDITTLFKQEVTLNGFTYTHALCFISMHTHNYNAVPTICAHSKVLVVHKTRLDV